MKTLDYLHLNEKKVAGVASALHQLLADFQGNNDFKDAEPDFSEEGWARRTPKKK